MRTRRIKDNYKMSDISHWKNRVASYCDEKNEERAGFRKKMRTLLLHRLNLRCPLYNQVEMLSRQLDVTVWRLEKMNGLETEIEMVIK